MKEYRMKGLLAENADSLIAMDDELELGGSSKIVPVYLKKDKTASLSKSRVVQPSDMGQIKQYVRNKHKAAGDGILSGETGIHPYRLKGRTACDYCSFKSVCQFDPTDNEQLYHQLQADKPMNIVTKMREELKNDGSINS